MASLAQRFATKYGFTGQDLTDFWHLIALKAEPTEEATAEFDDLVDNCNLKVVKAFNEYSLAPYSL